MGTSKQWPDRRHEPVVKTIGLGFRAHSVLPSPKRSDEILVFPAKTGREAAVVDLRSGQVVERFKAVSGGSFYGHGVFSPDGRFLFTTENRKESGPGLVTVRDGSTLKVEAELSSHGPSPHDLRFLPDGKTLCVANSALGSSAKETSCITLMDSATGELIEHVESQSPSTGIRHLEVSPEGSLIAIAQKRSSSASGDEPSLLVLYRPASQELVEVSARKAGFDRLAGHTLSVTGDGNGHLGITSPNGDRVIFWNPHSAATVADFSVNDPLGIVHVRDLQTYVVTTATGELFRVSLGAKDPQMIRVPLRGTEALTFTGHARGV